MHVPLIAHDEEHIIDRERRHFVYMIVCGFVISVIIIVILVIILIAVI